MIRLKNVVASYRTGRGSINAVDGVSNRKQTSGRKKPVASDFGAAADGSEVRSRPREQVSLAKRA